MVGKETNKKMMLNAYIVNTSDQRKRIIGRGFILPSMFYTGDAALFLVCLNQKLKGYSCPQDWVMSLKEADQKKEKTNR